MNIPSPLVLNDLLLLVLKNIRTGAVFYCILAGVIYWLLYGQPDHRNQRMLVLWLCCVLFIHVVGYIYSTWCMNQDFIFKFKKTISIVALLIVLKSVAWSSCVWFAMQEANQVQEILVITIVASLSSVVMISLAPLWPLAPLYGFTCVAVGAFKFLETGDSYPVISIAGIPYVIVLSILSRNSYLSIKNVIELNYKNRSLLDLLRKESEEAAQAKQVAIEANHAKSHFLASASHDLRQPLYALLLLLETLNHTEKTSKQNILVNKSLDAANDMADMLHAILDISRIEAGVIVPSKIVFSMQSLLFKIENVLGAEADAKGLVYRCRETNFNVYTDPVLLEQILRNIISNAIQYTQQGGILIGCRVRGQQLQIEVWDTGIGIEKDKVEFIFNAFNQIGNEERDRKNGFGLGLSIVKGLAEALKLPYQFQSTLGKGSCFKILVPISHEVVQDMPMQHVTLPAFTMDLAVLVIDDDAVVRDSMELLLRDWGCRCVTAENAKAAVQQALRTRPDLIISDHRLRHGMTGVHAIEQVRTALGHNIPALLVTGDTSPLHLHALMGADIPVLHKPISAQQLYSTMVALHSNALSPAQH